MQTNKGLIYINHVHNALYIMYAYILAYIQWIFKMKSFPITSSNPVENIMDYTGPKRKTVQI